MPELPEVETIVRTYWPRLEGRRVTRFVSRWAKQAQPSVATVRSGIVGKRIERLWRRAKFIVADVGKHEHLLIHLRMSGRFEWAADEDKRKHRHVRAFFDLDDGNRLLFCDSRKFGKIIYTTNLADTTSHLGVEPLGDEFTPKSFQKVLCSRSRQLKPLLLDQSVVAGLGNIYVDETLFAAGLHPLMRSDRVTPEQTRVLRNSIRSILRKAIRNNGTSFDWIYPNGGMERHLKVYGRDGEPCPTCGTPIELLRVGQRGTHVCPRCQPAVSAR